MQPVAVAYVLELEHTNAAKSFCMQKTYMFLDSLDECTVFDSLWMHTYERQPAAEMHDHDTLPS